MKTFKTHTGEIVQGERLNDALNSVANYWRQLAHDIQNEDAYASHVTETTKERNLSSMLEEAEAIRNGEVSNLTIWQRINEKLTGECVALLPK